MESATNQLYSGMVSGVEEALDLYIQAMHAESINADVPYGAYNKQFAQAQRAKEIVERHIQAAIAEMLTQPELHDLAVILDEKRWDRLAV